MASAADDLSWLTKHLKCSRREATRRAVAFLAAYMRSMESGRLADLAPAPRRARGRR